MDETETTNIESNQKKSITTLIELAFLIQKRGGLTVFQARDVFDAVEVFTSEKDQPRSQEDQLKGIRTLIDIANVGQSKGVVELNEAKIVANIIELLGNNDKLKESYEDHYLSLPSNQ